MLDAAAVDGAGTLGQLCCVAVPCRAAALGLAWIVAFAVALGDLGASVLVLPPGVNTLSLKIFDLLHSGVEDQAEANCLLLCVDLNALFPQIPGNIPEFYYQQGQPAFAGSARFNKLVVAVLYRFPI